MCSRFLVFCIVAIVAAGVTCLLAATYFFLEKGPSFVFAFAGVFTLLSWVLFLVYIPYGLVQLPWKLLALQPSPYLTLSAFVARVRKWSDVQYVQRVQQAEAFRTELKHALSAEIQIAEKLIALHILFCTVQDAFICTAGLWQAAAQVGTACEGESANPKRIAGAAACSVAKRSILHV